MGVHDGRDRATRQGVIAAISGFTPMLTGTLCDLCNTALAEGDDVRVTLDHHGGEWVACSTYCADHDVGTHETITNAVAVCELGAVIGGRAAPLYNPEIVAFFDG